MMGTAFRLLKSRNQFLKFDRNFIFQPASADLGPTLIFRKPVMTRSDVSTLANGRNPSVVDSIEDVERWIYRWTRRPQSIDRDISLELHFHDNRLSSLSLDPRFSEILGDARIEMLLRTFTSKITDLNLVRKEIRCVVPLDSLNAYSVLKNQEINSCFGRSNYFRSSEYNSARRHVYRYLLQGTPGNKGKMAFSAHLARRAHMALAISAKIGSYRLILDFSELQKLEDPLATRIRP